VIASINSQLLAQELRLLNKVVPTKPAIAILSHVLLKAEDEALSFYATDLELALETQAQARVTIPGTCALPMAKFLALVERFNDADVDITLENKGQVGIKCGAFATKLQALRAEDFPPRPQAEGSPNKLNALNLRTLIAKTRYAVAAGGSFTVLKGALLTLAGPVAAMAATDSKRLALATMQREGIDQRVIVPAKALDMLSQGADEGDVEMIVDPRHLFFKVGGRNLISRTIDGEFPKYERIIPRDQKKHVTIDKLAFASALRRVELIAEDTQAVYFAVEPGTLTLSAQSASVGSASESLRVLYEDEPVKVCMNGGYVLNFLDAAYGSSIVMSLDDDRKPALFTDGTDHVAVVMLMR
jgi:DNA polymerase-3 subunit beta